MEALNKKERNDAYASFMVFFLLTAALLLLAVFFGYRVPFKENERLRKQLKRYEHEADFMNTFAQKINEAKTMLDSVNLPGAQAVVIDGNLAGKIKELGSLVGNDSIKDKRVYDNAIQLILALQGAKASLRANSNTETDLGKVQQQVNQLRMDVQMCEQQKASMQATLMMYQNQR